MSKNKRDRERICTLCFTCINSCKEIHEREHCPHYKKMLNRFEYLCEIKRLNINVKKLCNQYGVSYNIMMNMLHGRQLWTYKYATIMNSRIYELEEYIKHYDNFDDDESSEEIACGEN